MAPQEQAISVHQDSNGFAYQTQPGQSGMDISDDIQMTENHIPVFHRSGGLSAPESGPSRATAQSSTSSNASLDFLPGVAGTLNTTSHDRSDASHHMSSRSPPPRSEKEDFHEIFSELMTDTEHEIAFLTRHYAEVIGPWLDLSDSQKFFTVYVPIRAINCSSLKYAIAAVAAKQLGRIKGNKASTARDNLASTKTYPNSTQVDWFLKAANYYYLAASDLNNSTSDGYTMVSSSAVLESPIEMVSRWLRTRPAEISKDSRKGLFFRTAEEMLAAVVLLTLYRLIDLDGEEWHSQLSGVRTLFRSLLLAHQTEPFSHGIRASFWNLARQDYIGSYFIRIPTHFDPNDSSLWRAGGISIDEQNKFHIVSSGPVNLPLDEQAANGLIWLVNKVINFLAESKQSQIAQLTRSSPFSSPAARDPSLGSGEQSYPDTNRWLDLCFEYQNFFEGVPETFRPCIRIEKPRDLTTRFEGQQSPFPEVFFSLPTCAATMQHYHFGRIALLLNRPPDDAVSAPSTAFDRLQGYREVTKEVEYRCREVSGIALGRPQGEVRIYMIPLLFAVGQCLERSGERQIIVDLLRDVEADLGWATEYAIQRLQASWSRS